MLGPTRAATRVTTPHRRVKKDAVYAGKPGAADPRRCYVRTPLDEHSSDHQRTRLGRRAGPPGGRRSAALDRGRAVRPRSDAPLRSHALRVRDRGGAQGRGLLSRAPSRGLRVDARPLHGGRVDRRAHRHRAPALARPARRRRRAGGDRHAHGGRPRGRQPAPVRADRPRPRAPAPAARRVLRDPGPRPRARGAAARARRVGRARRARGRPRRPPEGLPPRRRGPARRGPQVAGALRRGPLAHRHPVRLRRPRHDHRRLPARQPDHHRGKTLDGKISAWSPTWPRTSR